MVSFVIPCYKSGHMIKTVVNDLKEAMRGRDYEIILVNDCSPDDTFESIIELCDRDERIVGIDLNGNYGQHSALMAGFHYVSGDVIVCMDDDGQTPASEVGKLLMEIDNGRDVAYARYENKKHSSFRNMGSRVNDLMLRLLLNKPRELRVSSFFAAKRYIIDEIIKYTNPYPYIMGLVLRTTKNISNVDVEHRTRMEGKSGYSIIKLLSLWMNGFTAFSIKPLRIATAIGAIMALGSFLYGIITIVRKVLGINYVLGFSALMSVQTFIGGIILLVLGMIGEYIGRIYISMNNSPQFVVRQTIDNREFTDTD